MPERLMEIARSLSNGPNPVSKLAAGRHYDIYDQYLAELADQPVTLLELGTYTGESLKTFATYFSKGQVIGIDIADHGADFSGFSNLTFHICDQRDAGKLSDICAAAAPDGLDIIIDDASHYGIWSLMSYNALFDRLKPGGLYFVEDWGTGYWDDWPDGSRFQRFSVDATEKKIGKRIPSHDFGMVGFVKYLVDEVATSHMRPNRLTPSARPERAHSLHIHKELVVLRKAG
jgi:SAM-dependent methyltransferase